MKVKNLWIAMAALAVTGCSQNEITEMSPDANPAVGFSVYTGTQTRGAVIDLPALKKAPATTTVQRRVAVSEYLLTIRGQRRGLPPPLPPLPTLCTIRK